MKGQGWLGEVKTNSWYGDEWALFQLELVGVVRRLERKVGSEGFYMTLNLNNLKTPNESL